MTILSGFVTEEAGSELFFKCVLLGGGVVFVLTVFTVFNKQTGNFGIL